jgi:hypothetical protein
MSPLRGNTQKFPSKVSGISPSKIIFCERFSDVTKHTAGTVIHFDGGHPLG